MALLHQARPQALALIQGQGPAAHIHWPLKSRAPDSGDSPHLFSALQPPRKQILASRSGALAWTNPGALRTISLLHYIGVSWIRVNCYYGVLVKLLQLGISHQGISNWGTADSEIPLLLHSASPLSGATGICINLPDLGCSAFFYQDGGYWQTTEMGNGVCTEKRWPVQFF